VKHYAPQNEKKQRHLMGALVRWFDGWITASVGSMTISTEERCILKVELRRASGTLHCQAPFFRRETQSSNFTSGTAICQKSRRKSGWSGAVETWQRFQYSLRLLARQVEYEAAFQGVKQFAGSDRYSAYREKDSGARLMERLGFTVLQNPSPLGLLGKFGENLYSWILLWAYNPAKLPSHTFLRLERTGIWMSACDLASRFGKTETAG